MYKNTSFGADFPLFLTMKTLKNCILDGLAKNCGFSPQSLIKRLYILTEEKIAALKKQLKKGMPAGELMQSLKEEGYSEEEIKQVFTPKKYDMRSWYLVFGILFLLIGIVELLSNKRYLFLLFAAIMFAQYYREVKRVKSQ